jgi:hypothetical protein
MVPEAESIFTTRKGFTDFTTRSRPERFHHNAIKITIKQPALIQSAGDLLGEEFFFSGVLSS